MGGRSSRIRTTVIVAWAAAGLATGCGEPSSTNDLPASDEASSDDEPELGAGIEDDLSAVDGSTDAETTPSEVPTSDVQVPAEFNLTVHELGLAGLAAHHALSPDGKWVAYEGHNDTHSGNVCIESVGHTSNAPLCLPVDDFGWRSIAWFADSQRFIGGDDFTFATDTDITAVSVEGSTTTIDDDGRSGELAGGFEEATVISAAVVTTDDQVFGLGYGNGRDFGTDQQIVRLDSEGTWAAVATLPGGLAPYSGRFHAADEVLVAGVYNPDRKASALAYVDIDTGTVDLTEFDDVGSDRAIVRHVVDVAGGKVLTVKADLQGDSGRNRDIPFFEVHDPEQGSRLDVRANARLQPNSATLSPDGRFVALIYNAATEPEQTQLTLAIVGSDDPMVTAQTPSVVLSTELVIPYRSDGVSTPMVWTTDNRIVATASGVAYVVEVS